MALEHHTLFPGLPEAVQRTRVAGRDGGRQHSVRRPAIRFLRGVGRTRGAENAQGRARLAENTHGRARLAENA